MVRNLHTHIYTDTDNETCAMGPTGEMHLPKNKMHAR